MEMMKRILLITTVLFLTACESYQIYTYDMEVPVPNVEENKVKNLCNSLEVFSMEYNLVSQTPETSDVHCYFSTPKSEQHFIIIGARTLKNKTVVDIEGLTRNDIFINIKKQLENMLTNDFQGWYVNESK